jgi:deoxyribonuclease V
LVDMRGRSLHSWRVSVTEAKDIQRVLATQVVRSNELQAPHLIAGVDISREDSEGIAQGAVVVLSFPELVLVERGMATLEIDFPYVPGLLSFREAPLILAACERLTLTPDLFIADAQGIAHPRRLGLASHLGLLIDVPTIGCAKSILCGHQGDLGEEPGDYAPLLDGDEVIGAALRTKRGVNPVYVSVGHRVDLEAAIHWVMACLKGYRLPEPTRLAHLAATGKLTPVVRTKQGQHGRL